MKARGSSHTIEQLRAEFDPDGRPIRPFTVVGFSGMGEWVTSLEGATLIDCEIAHLWKVRTLNGVALRGTLLGDLHRLESIGNADIAAGCSLYGIRDGVDLGTPLVTQSEYDILKEIPLERLDMGHWHSGCGTVHCLAGWAQTLGELQHLTPWDAGIQQLPSLSHLFYLTSAGQSVKEMIVRILASPERRAS